MELVSLLSYFRPLVEIIYDSVGILLLKICSLLKQVLLSRIHLVDQVVLSLSQGGLFSKHGNHKLDRVDLSIQTFLVSCELAKVLQEHKRLHLIVRDKS